jgi:hypothetical protein
MTRRPLLLVPLLALALAGCPKPVTKDYTKFLSASPRSILVVPVVNNSVDVEAPTLFLSTVPIPVAERGYYVFPVNLVKRVLEDDGMADAAVIHQADPMRLCALFGADAVLFIAIQKWEAKYIVISTTVTVELEYELKDGKTGDTIWSDKQTMVYQPQSSGGGSPLGSLISAVVNAAVAKAAPNYMPLARQANATAMVYPGPGFPSGPYSPTYKADLPEKK